MRRSEALLALSLLALPSLAAPSRAKAADPAPVIAAERAFAARAAEAGIPRSFLDFMADEAIVFAPDPTSAEALYAPRLPGKAPKDGGLLLAWWPQFAGLSAAGDLGFTTGPVERRGVRGGYYFTVWKRQVDGAWKWIYDGGADSDASKAGGLSTPVRVLPPGKPGLASARAFAEVQTLEAGLALAARRDAADAYRSVVDPDSRIVGSKAPPAQTPEAVAAELATRPAAIDFTALGGEAARSGDLAWTYGEARWRAGGDDRRGHYVRIWQRRAAGWRLVFDELLEVEPPTGAG